MPAAFRWSIAFLVAAVLGWLAYGAWDQQVVAFDDSYISYRFADNLVAGHGLVYNPGEYVQGYTNFLWTLIAAAAIRLGLHPLEATRALGVGLHLASLAMLGWLACEAWLVRTTWSLLLLPALAVLVVPQGFAAMAGSGLEAPLVGFLLVAVAVVLYVADVRRPRTWCALALLLACACLTRLDCAVATAAAAVAVAWTLWRTDRDLRAALRAGLFVGVPVAFVVVAFLSWSYAYYGSVLPNTYYAKAADHVHIKEGATYLWGFLQSHPQSVPMLLAGIVAAVLPGHRGAQRVGVFMTLAVIADLIHVVRVGGDFMEYRFMWQLYGLIVAGGIVGIGSLLERGLAAPLVIVGTVVSITFQPLILEKKYGMQSLKEMNDYTNLGTGIGKRLGQVLPAETIIATTLAGTIAYYSKLTVIDQWGLNDAFVARQPFTANRLSRGHVKGAPEDYLRRRGVNLYIHHPVICSCSSPCREDKPNIFVRLSDGRCLRSWYLEQRETLTDHVCTHPEHFVLNQVECKNKVKPRSTRRRHDTAPDE